MTREVCTCGHHLDDHDYDDYNELGCSKCECFAFEEEEEDENS
jgi:hypothetical protein